jgi:hypothetical protein
MTGSQGSYVEDIYEKPASQFKPTNLERWKYTRNSLAYYSNNTNQSVKKQDNRKSCYNEDVY